MRLRPILLAIAVVTPLRAFAQTPAPAEAAPPPPPPPPAVEAVPPPPPPPPAPVDMPPPVAVAAPMAPAAPAPAAPSWKDLITIEGLADSYYQYNFTGPSSTSGPVGQRNFDLNSNAFTLNYAKVGIGVNADPVGFRLDLGYGATGLLINSANPSDATSDPFLVQQAYATFSPVKGLTIDFGKFVTTAGAEVIEANKNWLYSRSIAFFNIPLVHTGVRAGFKVNDAFSIQASVVNGWNGVGIAPDVTGAKTFGLSLNFTAPTGTNIVATGYFGKGEALIPGPGASTDTRILADLVVAHTMGPLGLNLNFDYVKDEMAGYNDTIAVSLMGRYGINENVAIAARGEYWSNAVPGASRVNQEEVTVGLAFPMASRFELRTEGRADFASVDIFMDSDGNASSNQVTGTVAALAWF